VEVEQGQGFPYTKVGGRPSLEADKGEKGYKKKKGKKCKKM